MRWDSLFADLQAQWEAEAQGVLAAEAAAAAELERSRLLLADRLRACGGSHVDVTLITGERLLVTLGEVGADWCSGSVAGGAVLVPLGAIAAVQGLGAKSAQQESAAQRRLGLSAPLRALARNREEAVIFGQYGEIARGVLLAAGQDHLDVAVTGSGLGAQAALRTVSLNAVVLIRSAPSARYYA